MTDLARGARARRAGRRPGWVLLTALLVLAIGASSALVFTNQVELLKLAVILALWAAVVAAFVSVIYRRQSDVDQARARDLKLVYDLQLDREISARREYELTVESQLRRELATELRAQANDEVSELRAELAALRTNLEILFDAELSDRPALEGERVKAVRGYSEWDRDNESARERVNRVASVRAEEPARRSDDNSIIDVHEEPLVPTPPRQPAAESYQQEYAPQLHEAYAPAPAEPGPRNTRTGSGFAPAFRRAGNPRRPPRARAGRRLDSAASPTRARKPGGASAGRPQLGAAAPRVSPADGPRRARRREPDPSGSNLPPPRRSHRRAEGPAQPEPQFTPPPQPEPQPQQPPTRAAAATAADSVAAAQRGAAAARAAGGLAAGQFRGPVVAAGAPGSNWNPGQAESPATPSWAYDNAPSRDKPSHRSPGIGEPAAEPPAERRGRHSSAPAESAPGQTGEPDARLERIGPTRTVAALCRTLRPRRRLRGPAAGDVTAAASTTAAPAAGAGPWAGDVAAATGQRSSSQHRGACRVRGAAVRRPVGGRPAGAAAIRPRPRAGVAAAAKTEANTTAFRLPVAVELSRPSGTRFAGLERNQEDL